MTVLAISTGQNAGAAKMTVAPMASTASASTITARLRWVASMAPPAGVWAIRPSSPLIVVTQPSQYGPSAAG